MDKSALKSKTLYVSIIVALAPLFPPVRELIAANPEAVSAFVGFVFGILRMVTNKAIVLKRE